MSYRIQVRDTILKFVFADTFEAIHLDILRFREHVVVFMTAYYIYKED